MPAYGFLLRTSDPWFLVRLSLLSVITIDGLKSSDFKPFGQQLWCWSSCIAADIGAAECEAA
jgi:hypothetical protein